MAFCALGFAGAGWTSRIPQLRQLLHLPTAEVGLLLAAVALGGAVATPAAGAVVSRLGSARTVGLAALAFAAALLSITVGVLGQPPALVGGLLVMGSATAVWDVAIAVQVGVIEQRLGRPVLAGCFGAFSAGAILGAGASAVLIALGVPPGVQFASTALLVGLGAAIVPRWLLAEAAVPWQSQGRGRTRVRWREGRTLALGIIGLAFAVAEGAGGGWIGLDLALRFHATASDAAGAYGVFAGAVATTRLTARWLTTRLAPPTVLRCALALAAIGVLVTATAQWPFLACVGIAVWGIGAALGLPGAISAGSTDTAAAAGRTTVITGIAYVGFLAGPAVIGTLAAATCLPVALAGVAVLLVTVIPFTRLASISNQSSTALDTLHLEHS